MLPALWRTASAGATKAAKNESGGGAIIFNVRRSHVATDPVLTAVSVSHSFLKYSFDKEVELSMGGQIKSGVDPTPTPPIHFHFYWTLGGSNGLR